MKPRMSLLTLGVRDLARSVRFYEQGLGLPRMPSPPEVAFFTLNGTWLGLYGRQAMAEEAGVADEGGGFAGFTIAHNVHSEQEVDQVLAQAEAAGLDNLRIACFDAVEVLRDWIAPLALDELVIEFPDPWHKKRHHKRRLIQPDFVKLAVSRLRCGGHLRLATDWAHYAAQMLDVLTAEATLRNTAKGYAARPASRPVTRFEARGERLGHEVFDLDFIKLEDASALAGSDHLELFVFANADASQFWLTARLDNLGKGASGAAVQNMNIALGFDEATGLTV